MTLAEILDEVERSIEHTLVTGGQAKLPHVPQLPDNTSTEPKGQHE